MADGGFTATPSKSPPILGASRRCLAGLRWAVADLDVANRTGEAGLEAVKMQDD